MLNPTSTSIPGPRSASCFGEEVSPRKPQYTLKSVVCPHFFNQLAPPHLSCPLAPWPAAVAVAVAACAAPRLQRIENLDRPIADVSLVNKGHG